LPRNTDRVKLLKHLCRKAQPYGDKSVGVATLLEKPNHMLKYTGAPSQWLAQQSKLLPKLAESDAIIGHTRMPTHGAVNTINCHPFRIGDWIAAHNGVIHNSSELMLKALYIAKGETDSEEALTWLATNSFSKESFDDIRGSFAIVAMKVNGSELVLAADYGTPLYICWFGDGLVWHKCEDALRSSLIAAGIQGGFEIQCLKNQRLHLPSKKIEDLGGVQWSGGAYTDTPDWVRSEKKSKKQRQIMLRKNEDILQDPSFRYTESNIWTPEAESEEMERLAIEKNIAD